MNIVQNPQEKYVELLELRSSEKKNDYIDRKLNEFNKVIIKVMRLVGSRGRIFSRCLAFTHGRLPV